MWLLILLPLVLGELQDPSCSFANFPFMIGIKETFSFRHVCAGTLVKPNTVLTLASCINERKDFPGFFTAVAGPSSIGRVGSQRIIADKIIVHRRFDRNRGMNDVGLLMLADSFELSHLVNVVAIAEQFIPDDIGNIHFKAVAIGWGPYHPGKRLLNDNRYLFNPKLQCVELDVLNETNCKAVRKGFGFESNKICAWVPNGDENNCQGDAGGPLISNGSQIGIISAGFGCDLSTSPAFYERLDRILDIFKQDYQIDIEFKSSSVLLEVNCIVIFISMLCLL